MKLTRFTPEVKPRGTLAVFPVAILTPDVFQFVLTALVILYIASALAYAAGKTTIAGVSLCGSKVFVFLVIILSAIALSQ